MLTPYCSVIIPAYQAARTLQSTLESLQGQTLSDIEVIVVDDGSTDSTAMIAKEFSNRDKRFKTYTKKNGGRSSARDYGIQKACGCYLLFLDSDDWLYPDSIDLLKQVDAGGNADVVCGSFSQSDCSVGNNPIGDGAVVRIEPERAIGLCLSFWEHVEDAPFPSYSEGVVFRSACGKLIKRSLVQSRGIRFCEGLKYGEDALFMYEVYAAARCIHALNRTVYHYYLHEQSTTKARILSLSDVVAVNALISELLKASENDRANSEALCQCGVREVLTMLRRVKPPVYRAMAWLLNSDDVQGMIDVGLKARYSGSIARDVYSHAILWLISHGMSFFAVRISSLFSSYL